MELKRSCALEGKCGSCQFINLSYQEELSEKFIVANKWLKRFCKVHPVLPSPRITNYRCKVQATCSMDHKNHFITGQYREQSHNLVSIHNCCLEDQRATDILATIRETCNKLRIEAYDEDSGHGFLRHILIRIGLNTKQVMVVLVVSKPDFPNEDKLVNSIVRNHNVKTVVEALNREHTSMVLPENPKLTILYGDGYITEKINGLTFSISPVSFFQVNPLQAEHLYDIAMEMADLRPTDTVIDAYCGTGTLGLIAAKQVKKVIGIELNHNAVEDAVYNAKLNHMDNVEFVEADAAKYLKEQQKKGLRCNVIFLDPPRSGSNEEFLAAASKMDSDVIIYISCNPETLSRDLRYLYHNTPYRVGACEVLDMFPGTDNIESIVLLEKI